MNFYTRQHTKTECVIHAKLCAINFQKYPIYNTILFNIKPIDIAVGAHIFFFVEVQTVAPRPPQIKCNDINENVLRPCKSHDNFFRFNRDSVFLYGGAVDTLCRSFL